MEGWKGGRVEGWKGGRVEGWKDGRVEGWKGGRVEGWKRGRVEEGKDGRVEGWKDGRMVYQSTDPAMKTQRPKYAQSDFSNRYRNRAGAICLVMKTNRVVYVWACITHGNLHFLSSS